MPLLLIFYKFGPRWAVGVLPTDSGPAISISSQCEPTMSYECLIVVILRKYCDDISGANDEVLSKAITKWMKPNENHDANPSQNRFCTGRATFLSLFPHSPSSDSLARPMSSESIFIRNPPEWHSIWIYDLGGKDMGEWSNGGCAGEPGRQSRHEQDYSEFSIKGQRYCFEVTHQNVLAATKHKPYSTTLPSRAFHKHAFAALTHCTACAC